MKLNIVKHSAISYNESVGISEERANEIGKALDEMNKRYFGKVVWTCDIMNEIAAMTDNLEEFSFALVSHCNFLAINYKMFLCPPKKREPAIDPKNAG